MTYDRYVPAPFFDVSRHVVIPERAEALVRPDRRGAFSAEVGKAQDLGKKPLARGPVPVIDRRKILAREFRVGRRLVPAHAFDGIFLAALRVAAELPGRGSRPARRGPELRERLLERDLPAFMDEGLLPVL